MKGTPAKKQPTKGGLITGGVIYIICAILLGYLGMLALVPDFKYMKDGANSIEQELKDNYGSLEKESFVEIDLDKALDWYAKTQYKIKGIIPAGTKYHALIYVGDNTVLSLTVNAKTKDKLDSMINQTADYLTGKASNLPTSVKFVGKVGSVPPEVSRYYTQAISTWGFSRTEYNILNLTVDTTVTKASIIGYTIVGILIIILFVYGAVRSFNKAKNLNNNQPINTNGYNQQGDFNVNNNMGGNDYSNYNNYNNNYNNYYDPTNNQGGM